MGSEIEPAELEELAVVAEAAKVAGFSQDRQGVDGSNARDLAQPPSCNNSWARRSISSRCRMRRRASLTTMRNMTIAGASSGTGSPTLARAVW